MAEAEPSSEVDGSRSPDGAVAYLTLLRARGCPRWLWKLSTSNPIVSVSDAEHQARWDETTEIRVPAAGATVLVEYVMSSRTTWTQKVRGELRPGDRVTFQASWWPWFTRRLVRERR